MLDGSQISFSFFRWLTQICILFKLCVQLRTANRLQALFHILPIGTLTLLLKDAGSRRTFFILDFNQDSGVSSTGKLNFRCNEVLY
jgi:hypothetical protein